MAYQEIPLEGFIDNLRSGHFILSIYDIYNALRKGKYRDAAFYIGLEFIPYTNWAGKKMIKLASKGRKHAYRFFRKIPGKKSFDVPRTDQFPARVQVPVPVPIPVAQQAKSVEPLETMRSFAGGSNRITQAARHDLQSLNQLITGDKRLQKLMLNPGDNVATAVRHAKHILHEAGYQTKVRGIFIWDSLQNDLRNVPQTHFIVLAKNGNNGVEFAVDLTAGRFQKFGFSRPIIETEEEWAKLFHNAGKNYIGNGVIKYKDFNTWSEAKSAFKESAMPISDLGEKVFVLGAPTRYANALKSVMNNVRFGRRVRNRFGKYFVSAKEVTHDVADSAWHDAYNSRNTLNEAQRHLTKNENQSGNRN
jgi:Dermonecrotoxin of the Papain-like fold